MVGVFLLMAQRGRDTPPKMGEKFSGKWDAAREDMDNPDHAARHDLVI